MAILENLGKYRNTGLLLLRIGLGIMFITHGFPKMAGGPASWEKVGGAMHAVGVHFIPTFWGFMAAFAETFGGFLILVGLFFRPACLLILMTMLVASAMKLSQGGGITQASQPIEMAIVFFSLLLIGPGKYSVDKK
ncbi:putative oxidoreductase [Pedobacter sp. UYP30]|uniref:DoxX family protein n=1 Tax=Pedobacter sp. UYP30 TaxID=1756400 RepID=UPI003395FB7F